MTGTFVPVSGYQLIRKQALSLLALRVSLGALMLVWGLDKFANPQHGVAVAGRFYFGLLDSAAMMPVLGAAQIALGLLVVVGLARRYAYPVLAGVTGLTLLGVWRSVVDPWGWIFERTNALFFPSLIIFAGVLVLIAFRDADALHLGRVFRPAPRPDATPHTTTSSTHPAPRADAHSAPTATARAEHRSF